jgi:hypothetical protein
MLYSPAVGDAVSLRLRGDYESPPGDQVPLALAPPCYTRPSGDAVQLALGGTYTPPLGDQVALALVCDDPIIVEPPPPPPPVGNIYNGLTRRVATAWDAADPRGKAKQLRWGDAPRKDHDPRLAWQQGETLEQRLLLRWSSSNDVDATRRMVWQWGDTHEQRTRLPWSDVPAKDQPRSLAWDEADPRRVARRLAWGNPPPKDTARTLPHDQGQHLQHDWFTPWGNPPAKDARSTLPWGWAEPLRQQFVEIAPPVPIIPPGGICYAVPPGDQVRLPLGARGAYTPPPGDAVPLPLICDDKRRFYVIKRTRIMNHTLSVVRLPDRTPIEVQAVSIRADLDSWAWSVELAPSRRADYHLLVPDTTGPREIEVAMDGHVWTFVIESVRERRQMPQSTFTATGRSRTAALASPYAIAKNYINPSPTTAAQAAARELEFTPFSLDWQLTDWPLPAGTWAYSQLTPMAAINRLAEAAGGVVQSHPEDLTVIVRPAYSSAPWQWAAAEPDVALDGQSTLEMGVDWQPGPQYLGVYVSGESQGVLINVIRQGSAGSPYAQMIVDPLITDQVPAIGRGIRVIADAENQRPTDVLLPLLAGNQPGIIRPGELVEVTDPVHGLYRARAESVSLNASAAGDALTIRQGVRLARHLPTEIGSPP